MDDHGEITDEDRRAAAEASGLPEAAVYGVSTFYDDLLAAAGRPARPRLHRHGVLRGRRATPTSTRCARASGWRSASAAPTARCRWPRRSASASATPRRRSATATAIDAGRGVVERVARRARAPRPPSRNGRSVLDEPVLIRPGDWSGLARALAELDARGAARPRSSGPTCAGAAAPASRPATSGASPRALARGAEVHRRQRRRGRPRLLHRQVPDGAQPGAGARGDGARGLRGRRRRTASCCAARSTRARSRRSRRPSAAARAAGWLGEDIAGSGFDFDVTVLEGAGSYVVGEETALLACIEGLRGTVSARPPFPAERGLYGLPTVVNNTETLANIPFIALHGAEAYRALSPGATPGLEARLLQRALRPPRRLRGPLRHADARALRGAGRAADRRPPDQGAPDRRPARRDPAGVAARHRRSTSTRSRPRAAWSATAASSPSTSSTDMRALARHLLRFGAHESCGKCFPVPDRPAAGARDVRGRGAGRPGAPRGRCSRRSSWPACAPTAAACRRRSAACWPTSPTSWGSADARDRRRPRARGGSRRRPCSRRSAQAGGNVPTLCFDDRQAPFGACRVCLVGARGRAGPVPACTTPLPRRAWGSTPRDATARRVVADDRRARPLRAAERPPAPHTELAARRPLGSGVGDELRWPGATHEVDARRAPPLPRLPARAVHLLRALRARLRRGPGRVRADRDRPRLPRNVTAGLDAGFRDSTCVSCGACADTCPTDAITEIDALTL